MPTFDKEVNINKLPKPTLPRTIYEHKAVKHFTTARHGKLTPFCCYPVKPNDTFSIDTAMFVKADIADEVPLDDIQVVVEYYYCPYRILEANFKEIVGDKDPDDNTTYSFAKTKIQLGHSTSASNTWTDTKIGSLLLPRLGYGIADYGHLNQGNVISISSAPLVAYAKIWNHNYRDTLMQNNFPFENLRNNSTSIYLGSSDSSPNAMQKFFYGGLDVNRTHDFFADGYKSPNLEGDISIALGNPLQLTAKGYNYSLGGSALSMGKANEYTTSSTKVYLDSNNVLNGGGTNAMDASSIKTTNLFTSTDQLTINQLLMAFALYNYQFKTQTYGTHYDDWLYAHFGLEVSMSLIDEPECLASAMMTLNETPVLNQGVSADLGKASGLSNTLFRGASFTKSFVEHGLLIGVMSFRVNSHIYAQGFNPHVWDVTDEMDLVTPEFLNIGRVVNPMTSIYNDISSYNTNNQRGSFNYINAYDEFRKFVNRTSGLFAPIVYHAGGSYSNFIQKWTYQDIYSQAPTFSDSWLKEDPSNVQRTLTGRLIPGAPTLDDPYSQQYIVEVAQNIKVAQVMPAEPVPAHLVNRLK